MGATLMMSVKLATPAFLKKMIFRNKGYDVIIHDYDVPNKVLPRDSNYILDVVMWPGLVTLAFLWEKLSKPQFYLDLTTNWGVVLLQVQ